MLEILPNNKKLLTRLRRGLTKKGCRIIEAPTHGQYVVIMGLNELMRKQIVDVAKE